MSLAIDVEIELMDTAVRRCTQALINCGATGCFIDVEWAQSKNVPTCPLTNPIPVYNVDGTANEAGMIVEIADMILRYDGHSERTRFAVTRLGKQSMILGYKWLRNHNQEINWQTKDVKMSRCPTQCSTCRVETKHEAIAHKATISRINACRAGAFPSMIEELDVQDEATHVNVNETEEEAQGEGPAFDDDLEFDADHIEIEEGDRIFMAMVHPVNPQHFIRALSTVSGVMFHKCLTPKSVTIRSYKQQK
jgi:hypothetical protein